MAKVAGKDIAEPAELTAATVDDSEEYLTSPGAAIGRVAYMSPEQVRGGKLDARTDSFSFGVSSTKWHLENALSAATLRAPAPPVRLNPEMPAKLEEVINKALEKDRDIRCQSAAELQRYILRVGPAHDRRCREASCRSSLIQFAPPHSASALGNSPIFHFEQNYGEAQPPKVKPEDCRRQRVV